MSTEIATAGETSSFSIVMIGHMNPAIHHPSWYNFNGLMSKEEAEVAVTKDFLCTPQYSHFWAGDIEVTCFDSRFSVKCTSDASRGRLADLIARIFDDLLKHTPVSVMGINNDFCLDLGDSKLRTSVARRIGEEILGFQTEGDAGGGCHIRFPIKLGIRKLEIATSAEFPSRLTISINSELRSPEGKVGAPFDLKPVLEEIYDLYYEESVSIKEKLRTRFLKHT